MDLTSFALHNSSPEPTHLAALRRATWQRTRHGRLMTDADTGRFLTMVSRMLQPRTILELGTFTGYGTLCMLEGLADDGVLHTVERNDELFELQDEHWFRHARGTAIRRHHGEALEVLSGWPGNEPIDLAYIDADKQGLNAQLDALLPLMAPEGWMLFDNTWWGGTLEGPDPAYGAKPDALRALNQHLKDDPSLHTVVLPVGDGLTVVRKA